MIRSLFSIIVFAFLAHSVIAQNDVSRLEQDLRYVTDNAFAVSVIRPAKMFEIPGISGDPLADLAGSTGIKPSEVEQMVQAIVPGHESISSIILIKLTRPLDPDRTQKRLSPNSTRIDEFPYPIFDGQASQALSLAFPKPDQLVISSDMGAVLNAVQVGFEKAIPKPKLVEMCGKQTSSHLFFASDIDRLEHYQTFSTNNFSPEMPWGFKEFQPKSLKRIRGSIDFASQPSLRVEMTCSADPDVFREEIRSGLNQAQQAVSDWLSLVTKSTDSATPSELSFANLVKNLRVSDVEDGAVIESAESSDPISLWKQILDGTLMVRKSLDMQLQSAIAKNELRNIVLAMLNYESAYGKLPTNIYDKDGSPLLSWRVAILPFLDETELYKQFKLNEPWDSDHNKALLKFMPRGFRQQEKDLGKTKTTIQCPLGKGIGAISPKGITFKSISDGSSNTIAVLVSDVPVPWTKPADHDVDLADPWKNISDNSIVCLFDGSVREIDKQAMGKKLAAAFTRASNDGRVEFHDEEISFSTFGEYERRRTKLLMDRFDGVGLDQESADLILKGNTENSNSESSLNLGIKLVGSQDPDEIAIGLILLSRHEPTYDWKELKPLLDHRFEFIRYKAIALMARTDGDGVVAAIFRPGSADQGEVWQALYETDLKERAAEELLPMLNHADPTHRMSAAWVITIFGGEPYRKRITALLDDKDETVRTAAKNMIRSLDTPAKEDGQ